MTGLGELIGLLDGDGSTVAGELITNAKVGSGVDELGELIGLLDGDGSTVAGELITNAKLGSGVDEPGETNPSHLVRVMNA